MERAIFAAGSFERVEETFRRIEGVQQTMAGYAGGSAPDPSYFDVCAGTTGHAEVAEIYFDPGQVSYEQLPNVFWDAHDPTRFNRRVGNQYRSAIFFHSLEQEAMAHASKKRLRQRQVHAADCYRDSARNPVLSSGKIPPASHREAGRCGLSGMRW